MVMCGRRIFLYCFCYWESSAIVRYEEESEGSL